MSAVTEPDKSPRVANRASRPAEISNFEIVTHYFDMAADRLGLEDDVRAVLRSNYREVQVQVPIRQADGRIHVYSGYRVQHNGARGPYKGGVRCDPTALSRDETQAITRSFIDKVEKVLGPTRDIPAPDVNTNAQVMAWMMDEYGKLHGHTPAICTGKPIALGGSYGRDQATGRGCVYMFREAAPQIGLTPAESTFVVQGYGNVGSWAARILQQLGAKMIGVSDATGAIQSEGGIDADELVEHLANGG